MKKSLLWVVLLGITLSFSSCDKDSDPAPPIAGIWARSSYEFTEVPAAFKKYYEGRIVTSIIGETNYILIFKADGSYSRKFTLDDTPLEDKGKYTLDGTSLKLAADKASDIDLTDRLLFPGREFTVSGEIGESRLTMVRVLTLGLFSDAVIDAAIASGEDPSDDLRQAVDVTLIYKFDKVQ